MRSYGEETDRRIEERRDRTRIRLLERGWKGEFPYFEKQGQTIEVFEEQPFTVLDDDDLKFSLKYMLEESKRRKIRRHVFDSFDELDAYLVRKGI